MISVRVLINGKPLYMRSAIRIKDGEKNTYKVDDGTIIKHKGKDGAVKLAKKMLDTIKELGER